MALQSRRCWLRAILLTLPLLCSDVVASAASQCRQHADPSAAFPSRKPTSRSPFSRPALWTTYHHRNQSGFSVAQRIGTWPRGGSSVGEEEDADSDDEYDEYDQYDDDEEESQDESIDSDTAVQIEVKVEKFDEPLVASPMANVYSGFAILLLSRKIDLFHPTVVRIARFAFIAYLAVLQLFLLYVRVQAKLNNDRTPIELKNPLSSVLQSQLGGVGGGGGGGDNNNNMMKNLASSLLSSTSTVLEYDLKQARSMQSGLIFNMLFVWFLHFKMEQVQPLLIQTLNGLTSMVYSPLFQVYVLGRNLERPFQNPALKRMQDAAAAAAAQQEQSAGEDDGAETGVTVDANDEDGKEEEEDESDSEAEASVDDEDESEPEESEAEAEEDAESEKEDDGEEVAGGDSEEESEVVEAEDEEETVEKPDSSASAAEENDAGESEADDKASADEGAKTEE